MDTMAIDTVKQDSAIIYESRKREDAEFRFVAPWPYLCGPQHALRDRFTSGTTNMRPYVYVNRGRSNSHVLVVVKDTYNSTVVETMRAPMVRWLGEVLRLLISKEGGIPKLRAVCVASQQIDEPLQGMGGKWELVAFYDESADMLRLIADHPGYEHINTCDIPFKDKDVAIAWINEIRMRLM